MCIGKKTRRTRSALLIQGQLHHTPQPQLATLTEVLPERNREEKRPVYRHVDRRWKPSATQERGRRLGVYSKKGDLPTKTTLEGKYVSNKLVGCRHPRKTLKTREGFGRSDGGRTLQFYLTPKSPHLNKPEEGHLREIGVRAWRHNGDIHTRDHGDEHPFFLLPEIIMVRWMA